MSFFDFLNEKFGEHYPEEIEELILDDILRIDQFTLDHKTTLERYKKLIHLSLEGIGLKNLSNFPSLPNLQNLNLNNNHLTGSDLSEIKRLYPGLKKLKLSNNNITSLEPFNELKNTNIKKLEIFDNPVMKNKDSIENLFDIMENTRIINRKDKGGNEYETTIDENDEEEEDDEDFPDDGEDEEEEEDEVKHGHEVEDSEGDLKEDEEDDEVDDEDEEDEDDGDGED